MRMGRKPGKGKEEAKPQPPQIPAHKQKLPETLNAPLERKTAGHEAGSKYQPNYGTLDLHSSLIKLFHEKAQHPDKFFGCMMMIRKDGKKYYVINQHQLTDDTYVIDSDKREKFVKTGGTWKLWLERPGTDSVYYTPVEEFKIQLQGVKPVGVIAYRHGTVCTLVGIHPDGIKPYSVATDCEANDGYIKHSASTVNNCCGAFLYDSSQQAAVAIHTKTDGPNPNGMNNICVSFF